MEMDYDLDGLNRCSFDCDKTAVSEGYSIRQSVSLELDHVGSTQGSYTPCKSFALIELFSDNPTSLLMATILWAFDLHRLVLCSLQTNIYILQVILLS